MPIEYIPAELLNREEATVRVLGAPTPLESGSVRFDGSRDGIIIHENAIAGAARFEIRVSFLPEAGGAREQRFFHIQDSESEDRFLLETRVTESGYWFGDTFLKSGEAATVLQDQFQLHPLGRWFEYTARYDGSVLTQTIDGVLECSVSIPGRNAPRSGVTSIGIRANETYPFRGEIGAVRMWIL